MKNLINYYYDLLIKDFKKNGDKFIFNVYNKTYEFVPFYGDINEFYKTYSMLIRNKKYCHELILNKDKNLLTFYNNKPYLLLKKNIFINKCVDINEIINYDTPVYINKNLDWKKLWKEKIDYYEYQMSHLSQKYRILKNSFDYYIGLSETAIALLNYIEKKDIKYYISHKRITENENLDSFFNPINIIIDSRVRDIAEYFKANFFNEFRKLDLDEVFKYLEVLNFDNIENILFLARLLYPSYYFDMYDKIIQEKIREDKVEFYIKRNTSYEAFLFI